MRIFIVSVLIAFAWPVQAAEKAKPIVNLDSPGVLTALEKENPEHYRKIVEILRISEAQPCETLPKILKTRLNVADVECRSYMLLTSDPPKVHLSFTVDEVGYVTNAVQHNLGGKIVPAK